MIFFFDTSALVKRYILETGSKTVDGLFLEAKEIIVSPVTKIEIHSTIKRLYIEKRITINDYQKLLNEINQDFQFFTQLKMSNEIETKAIQLIDKYQLKTLDSIQLSTCLLVKKNIANFILSDKKLKAVALQEKIDIIDPTDQ